MPRIINHRTFLYTAISVLIGAFVSVLFCIHHILAIIFFVILIATNAVLFALYRKRFNYSLGFAIGAVALTAMLILTIVTTQDRYADLDYDSLHNIQGSVYSVHTEAGECDIIADELTIDGKRYSGKMHIYAETKSSDKLEFLREGDIITVEARIYRYELITADSINTYSISRDLRYVIYTESSDIAYATGSSSILEKLRSALQARLVGFMGSHYGNLSFGILTGGRGEIDISTTTYFGISGIGHILAVSGLHVGFIVALISFLMKRVSARIKVPIITLLLFSYTLFVGFSPSVLRAVIMSSVCLLTLINGQRSDILNNLSLAFTAIVTVSPFILFDASFLMSFSAVFGIACFSNVLTRIFTKCKFPHMISSAISVIISAQIGIMPCLLYFFHSLPLYSVIVNIILMPVITLFFAILILTCIIFLPFSLTSPLVVPQSLLILLDGVAQFTAALPFAQITLYTSRALFALYPIYFVISPYVMFPRFKRLIALCAVVGSSIVCSVSVIHFDIDSAVIPIRAYSEVTSLIHKDNKVILVGDCRNGKQISRTLHCNYLGKIDAIYLTSMSRETAEAVLYLRNKGECSKVYCPYGKEGEGMTMLLDNDVEIYIFDQTEMPKELNAEYFDNSFVGYNVELEQDKKLLFLGVQTNYDKLDATLLNSVSVIRCRFFNGYLDDRIFLTNFSVDTVDISDKYVYPIMNIGSYIFDYNSGKFYKSPGN